MTVMNWKTIAIFALGFLATRGAAAQEDPGAMGPHSVTTTEYGSFATTVSLGAIPNIEVLAEVCG